MNGEPKIWTLNDFEIGCIFGRGKFGHVYLAREKYTKYTVAIKMMIKSELIREQFERQVLREIEIHNKLNHPYILRLMTYFYDEKKIYLVLEYAAGGELYHQLQDTPHQRFTEQKAAGSTCPALLPSKCDPP